MSQGCFLFLPLLRYSDSRRSTRISAGSQFPINRNYPKGTLRYSHVGSEDLAAAVQKPSAFKPVKAAEGNE
jgi:hypothetical protein